MKSKKISSFSLLFVSAVIFVCLLAFSSLAIAYANNNDEEAIGVSNADSSAVVEENLASNDLPSGISIWKSFWQPAQSGTDYSYENDIVTIKTDGLTVRGSSLYSGVDVGFLVTNPKVKNLTLENLYINYGKDHHALRVQHKENSSEENAYGDNFTLHINGHVYLDQNNLTGTPDAAIIFNGGDVNRNFTITGGPFSFLECYSQSLDCILVEQAPLCFSGFLETTVYSESGDSIDWVKDKHDNLTITDNAILEVGNPSESEDTSIYAGSINVLWNGSLYVANYNTNTRDLPAVKTSRNFTIDTSGEVFIDAYNPKSFQAVVCDGDMSILRCSSFTAIAQDYSALDVKGKLIITSPNVYLSGQYWDKNNQYPRRGAFTVTDIDNLYVAPWISAYGSEYLKAYDAYFPAVVTFSAGTSYYYPDLLYTPVVVHGLKAGHVASTVIFKSSEDEVVEVPGQDPTYEESGFKPCYKSLNSGQYFEDEELTRPILNYHLWKTVGDGYLPPLKEEFNAYRETVKTNCDSLLAKGDTPEVRALIDTAKANIDAYQYDNALSIAENKASIDAIFTKLAQDVDAILNPGGGGDPVNPTPGTGGGSAETSDSMPVEPLVALFVIAALTSALTFKKYRSFS